MPPPAALYQRRSDTHSRDEGGACPGVFLLRGALWARIVGVVVATISAIVNFAWLPWYPIWGAIMIAVDVFVIWALTAHGRDITRA